MKLGRKFCEFRNQGMVRVCQKARGDLGLMGLCRCRVWMLFQCCILDKIPYGQRGCIRTGLIRREKPHSSVNREVGYKELVIMMKE